MSYFCYQGNNNDCGFASLKMLMASYAHNRSYLFIKKEDKKENFTFLDLIYIARKYDFEIEAFKVNDKSFDNIEAPFLARYNSNHLVMVNKITKKYVEIYDPDKGKQKIEISDFKIKWTGECLVRKENSIPMKLNIKEPNLISKKGQIFQMVLMFVIMGVLFTGLYFINENSNFLIVIGLLILFILCELVENWYIIKNIKYFDSRYIPQYFSNKSNRNYYQYKEYIEFKENFFKSRKSILASLLFIISLCILLSINDLKNILVFAVIFCLKIFDKFVFKNKKQSSEEQIGELERKAFENKDESVNYLLKANTSATNFGLFLSVRKIIFIFILATISILMMVFNHLISTNYVIFQFGSYYVISTSFDGILDYLLTYKKTKKSIAKFMDKCNM